MHEPLVSIIIPTRNRKVALWRLLESIGKVDGFERFEVIVVNDGGEKIFEMSSFGMDFSVYENDRNRGLAYSRTRGATVAKGKYVLFIDDDNVIDSSMVKALVDVMESNVNLAGVGPITYYYSSPEKVWFLSARIDLRTSKSFFLNAIDQNSLIDGLLFPTGNLHNCFLLRRDWGDEVGWFDEEIFMSGTEFDLLHRICEKHPDSFLATHVGAKCYHDVPIRAKNLLRSMGFENGKRVYYFQRNRGVFTGKYGTLSDKWCLGLVFYPLFFFGYGLIFLLKGRTDFFLQHWKGTADGYKRLIS